MTAPLTFADRAAAREALTLAGIHRALRVGARIHYSLGCQTGHHHDDTSSNRCISGPNCLRECHDPKDDDTATQPNDRIGAA